MLLQFRIKNYRSIHDVVVLNLLASADKDLAATNLMPTGLKGLSHAVRTAVIYGPNASGKSNVLQALAVLMQIGAELQGEDVRARILHAEPLDDAAAKRVGEWTEGTATKGYIGQSYLHDGDAGTMCTATSRDTARPSSAP